MKFCPSCAAPLISKTISGQKRLVCPKEACGFVFYKNPTPVVAALLEHEGEVILVRNKGWPGKWFGLVTGFLESEETPEEGVLREVKEELDLRGEIVRLIGVYTFFEMNQLIVAYHVRGEGQIRLGEELEEYKRIRPETLRPWALGTGLAVRDWLASRAAIPQSDSAEDPS